MNSRERRPLISVKRGLLRHPAVVGAGAAALVALLALNAAAFVRGLAAPWLLGGVIVADMLVIGVGVLVAAREVLTADTRLEAGDRLTVVMTPQAAQAWHILREGCDSPRRRA